MFSRVALFALLALPAFGLATPIVARGGSDIMCCNTVEDSKNPSQNTLTIIRNLGINVSDITGQIGVTCVPIGVLGVGSNSCTEQKVTCTNNSFNGVIAFGCSPVNVNV